MNYAPANDENYAPGQGENYFTENYFTELRYMMWRSIMSSHMAFHVALKAREQA